ncbi:MAG: peptide ABC transporter substrate-binding protein [Chloroflexi bacterium]|nr:peptide ABC transporter substrate-binding protein [Chloroflexota bacterium]
MTLFTARSSRFATLVAAMAIVVGACSSPASNTPSSPAESGGAGTPAPSTSSYAAEAYPADADAPCDDATKNSSEFKRIKAVDEFTVEFDLCAPDVAFLSKIAFASNAIQDSDWLKAHMADKSILRNENGTGPYTLKSWDAGNRMDMTAFAGYWGNQARTPNLEFQWSDQAVSRTQALVAGTVDGIDNPGAEDIKTIQGHEDLKFNQREGLSTLYVGMNVLKAPWTDENVRKAIAMSIDRQSLVDHFYPPGSSAADYFTPCAIPFGCVGDKWYDYDPAAAKALLTQAGFPNGFTTTLSFRAAVRGYLPDPPAIATAIAADLKKNLGITATLDLQESGAFLSNAANGSIDGLYLLGWGADFPDVTNFLDYHFGSGSGAKFGKPFDDIVAALKTGGSSASDADRTAAYTTANNAIKAHVPMALVAHGGSGDAFKADVVGSYASPIGSELFYVMSAGTRDTLVWMQNAEPLSLYCGDESDGETLRACEQMFESLYTYEIGGTKAIPALATDCAPNADLTVWTCHLRQGVKFHQSGTLDANDVVDSLALQWDTKNPLHVGNTGDFEYFPGLFGGNLNPPPAS